MARGYRKKREAPLDENGNQVILQGDKREAMLTRARNSVLYQLGSSPRSRFQLAIRLKENGISDDIIEEVLDRYVELGFINDASFANSLTESRHRSKGLARNAIKQELKQKGVSSEEVAMALENISEEDEYKRAYELVVRKAPSTARLEKDARTRRLVGMLSRKGYSPNIAFKVVKEVLSLEISELPEGLED